MSMKYLDNYDSTALLHPTMFSLSSAYKGFNDTLAAWGTGRIIGQQCGQTWLQTLADAGKHYSSTKQLLGIQLVTWNDYEEGSEIETGIDNCVSVAVNVTGTVASWAITGQLNTIDHFSVYISQDGQNLMWLADAPVSATSLDLAQFSLNAGNYIVFVKATGKPSLTNKMSTGVQLTVPNRPPTAVLSVTPTSGTAPLTVSVSTAGSSDADGNVASTTIDFGDGSAAARATSASHVYSAAGTYTVKATVTDNLGSSSTATALVKITSGNKPPLAALSLSSSAAYAPASITASTAGSSDPDGTIASSSINFGDGSAAVSGPSAPHSYSTAGTYTVTAIVTDNLGASSSASASVTVKAPEVIVASPAPGAQVTSPFHVTATGFSGNTVTAMQIYLDGTLVVSVKSPDLDTSVAASVGTHTLVVKGWDSSHKNFFTTLPINVAQPNQPPVAALSLSTTSLLQGASVNASTSGSTDPDGSVASSSIEFGDGSGSVAGPIATHQFTTAGTFTVQAVVTDNDGASSTVSQSVVVKPRFVTIASPTFATTTSTSVRVVGTAFSGYAITATQVYLDGVLKFKTTSATADTTLAITKGTHTVVVKGWDSTHTSFFSSVTFTKQ
jgi:PKD repeat protein